MRGEKVQRGDLEEGERADGGGTVDKRSWDKGGTTGGTGEGAQKRREGQGYFLGM